MTTSGVVSGEILVKNDDILFSVNDIRYQE